MYDKGKIIVGLVIFLVIVSFPFWFNFAMGDKGERPQLQKAAVGDKCILGAEAMRHKHMDLLNTWRDEYVREGKLYVEGRKWPDGKPMYKSLSKTCLGCHKDKTEFCDKCHTYAGAEPYCWDCHVLPGKGR